tara:strand:+ start:168 stop:353 length:186 start_codon:yes stop_codon:yes gene_type:complete
MKTYQIHATCFYVNDSVHWFGPFKSTKELDSFYSDSNEEQWFAAVRNKIVIDLLKALKEKV